MKDSDSESSSFKKIPNKRKKAKTTTSDILHNKIVSSNQFAILEDMNTDQEQCSINNMPTTSSALLAQMKKRNQSKETIKRQQKTSPNSENEKEVPKTATVAEKKPPPIKIFKEDSKLLSKLLKNEIGEPNFKIKNIGHNKLSLSLKNKNDCNKVKDMLNETGAEYFPYTHREDKLQSFLLKGLSVGYNPDEVLKELNDMHIENLCFVRAFRYATVNSKRDNRALPIIAVQLSPDSKVQNLRTIRFIEGHLVSFEKIRRICRCIKCQNTHEPGECQVEKDAGKEQLFCVLCQKPGHPASWRGCESSTKGCAKSRDG